jgi:hypothetical protein
LEPSTSTTQDERRTLRRRQRRKEAAVYDKTRQSEGAAREDQADAARAVIHQRLESGPAAQPDGRTHRAAVT